MSRTDERKLVAATSGMSIQTLRRHLQRHHAGRAVRIGWWDRRSHDLAHDLNPALHDHDHSKEQQ